MHDVVDLSDELRGFELRRVILATTAWKAFAFSSALNWNIEPFAKAHVGKIPKDVRGVYSFVAQPGIANHPLCAYLLYVGKAAGQEGFRSRYKRYLSELTSVDTDRPLVRRMIRKWHEYLWFCFAEVDDALIDAAENALIEAYLPPINSTFPARVSKAMRAFG